jgi:hypothetical protein
VVGSCEFGCMGLGGGTGAAPETNRFLRVPQAGVPVCCGVPVCL